MRGWFASLLLVLLLAPGFVGPAAADPSFGPDARRIVKAGFAANDIGFVVVDLDQVRPVVEWNADQLFIPASVAKLATVYAAEQILGPDFRFRTRLWRAGGTLYLQGGGDPVLTNIELRDLARMLKDVKIDGGWRALVYDASALEGAPEVDDGQPIQAVYNAGFGALDLDFNRVQVNWLRGEDGRLGFKARMVADGLNVPADWISFLPATTEPPPGANFLYAGDRNGERWLTAPDLAETLPEEGAIFLPVKDPALNTARVFRRMAADLGAALPAPAAGVVPADAELIGTVESPPLSEIIKGLLKFSNNVTAELIGATAMRKLAGRVLSQAESGAALTAWLKQRFPAIEWRGLALVNHSGLGNRNRASPRQIAGILTALSRDPVLAGLMNRIMTDDPKAEAAAKTGTMDFACGLGGLFTGKSGRRFAFAMFVYDRNRRARLDADSDRRILAPTPGAESWLGRAHALEYALLKDWRDRL
ncbi:MAG TPA: D-alanyl-D-alanine carboxypeptidase [Dongiaceae bacterium]|jgi:D-alanyl-D-alanine carboxypeptidase/D-alanyl-D-alanine-endopeptidase (penicillin-binding protein 4)|nr:D-alanyl-D-alanine carboxypeptidase [Dongiaceae bacterium]